ncbi:MAG: MBL fold metallo-hydrolase [Gammaproteobacteria bacterium]|nr:MBL fold metallo-hydrolase [Gammaproteobacteria bacterium]
MSHSKIDNQAFKVLAFSLLVMISSSFVIAGEKLLDGETLVEEVKKRIPNLDTQGLQEQLEKHPETIVIDVRNKDEISSYGGMIKSRNTLNISRGWLEYFTPQNIPESDTPIVVYCGTGQRSPFATETLMQLGYSDVKNYLDGFFVWRDKGLPVETGDKAPNSMLYSKPQQVSDNVWSAIGATAPPTYENSGHNNNLSFIVTQEGVVVVNAGDNYLLAKALHDEIMKITDQPVKYVVLENAQGHAMLGSNYWKEQGAMIIAHQDAIDFISKNGKASLERMKQGRKDKALGTKIIVPDIGFKDKYEIKLGGESIELLMLGPAHSAGDISVWLPDQKLVIAGDIAFHQRMLFIDDHTDTAGWVETWDKFEEVGAEVVIPGHGIPTTMDVVTRWTKDYLVYMRNEMEKLIDEDKTLDDAYKVDQSAYSHLDTFHELARQNAGIIFRSMEFE